VTADDVVTAPDGTRVVLGEIGQKVVFENDRVRVWEVALAPGEDQPWHLHHNPYLVLCLEASPGRMDWLDGAPPRHLSETVGGVVFRPTSPVHMLTNVGETFYRNRLVETKDLGEDAVPGPTPTPSAVPASAPDGSPHVDPGQQVLWENEQVRVWRLDLAAGETRGWAAPANPWVLVTREPAPLRRIRSDSSVEQFDDDAGAARYDDGVHASQLLNLGTSAYSGWLIELLYRGENAPTP